MGWQYKLRFSRGGTITGERPGDKIQKAVGEIQKKTITNLTSDAPGLAFKKMGANSWALVHKGSSGGAGLLRVGEIKNDGAAGDAKIRFEGGLYYLDITFPRVNRSTSIEIT